MPLGRLAETLPRGKRAPSCDLRNAATARSTVVGTRPIGRGERQEAHREIVELFWDVRGQCRGPERHLDLLACENLLHGSIEREPASKGLIENHAERIPIARSLRGLAASLLGG